MCQTKATCRGFIDRCVLRNRHEVASWVHVNDRSVRLARLAPNGRPRRGRWCCWKGYGLPGGGKLDAEHQLVDDPVPQIVARRRPSTLAHLGDELRALLEDRELGDDLQGVIGLEHDGVPVRVGIVLARRA